MVLAPSKIARTDIEISGKVDFSNQNGDNFMQGLRNNGIDVIDLRDDLINDNLNQHELFFVTDHHWLPSTARWAASHVEKYLSNQYGFNDASSLLDEKNWNEVVYPNWFLGSRGKKVTLARAKPEDISLYYPKFPTNFELEIPSMNMIKDGDFSILYDMKKMKQDDIYEDNPYATYSYGDRAIKYIRNKNTLDTHKVMILSDSFGDSMIPFLATGIKEICVIDLRHFDGSLRQLMSEYKPDDVIVLYFVDELTKKINYTNNRDIFDFR